MKPTLRIAAIAVRELLYEKVFYVLLAFALFALALSALLGNLTYVDHQKLTLDFLLAGIQISMLLFAIFMGVSLFQRELTLGSVSMVLSKPISRSSFLLGKYLGQIFVQTTVTLLMGVLAGLVANSHEPVSVVSLGQTLLMILFEVYVVTASAYFFAVNAGAITAVLATLSLFLIGHYRETASKSVQEGLGATVWPILKNAIPNLDVFNMKSLASYGISIPWNQMGLAGLYAVICAAAFLIAAVLCFGRKDIFT